MLRWCLWALESLELPPRDLEIADFCWCLGLYSDSASVLADSSHCHWNILGQAKGRVVLRNGSENNHLAQERSAARGCGHFSNKWM